MIRSCRGQGAEDIAKGEKTKAALRILPAQLHGHARRRLQGLQAAKSLADIRSIRGNRYHRLTGDRKGKHSIAINGQYRICFDWTGTDAENVEIVDYHD
jgi:toxin HigB-1